MTNSYIPPPRSLCVTDDLLDASDGAEVSIRYKRVGSTWEQIAVECAGAEREWLKKLEGLRERMQFGGSIYADELSALLKEK